MSFNNDLFMSMFYNYTAITDQLKASKGKVFKATATDARARQIPAFFPLGKLLKNNYELRVCF